MEDSFEGIYLNNYKFEKYIRGDSHCAVFQGVHLKTARKVAIKSFFLKEMHPRLKEFIKNDLDRYRSIKNPNVLRIEEYFESDIYGFMVYEYCKDHTLEDFWTKHKKIVPEKKLIKIVRQMFNGFKALWEKKIFGRDYKLKNILVSENKVKIGECLDFIKTGSVLFQNQREYLAPEILEEGDTSNKIIPSKADLWSLGVALYKLTYGKSPFQGINDLLLLKDINKYFENAKNVESEKFNRFKRQDLKFGELFKDLFVNIFKKLEDRHITTIFQQELLIKKFQKEHFCEPEDEMSLKILTENKFKEESERCPFLSLSSSNNPKSSKALDKDHSTADENSRKAAKNGDSPIEERKTGYADKHYRESNLANEFSKEIVASQPILEAKENNKKSSWKVPCFSDN